MGEQTAESCVIPCRNQSGELREIPRSVSPNDGLHRPSPSQEAQPWGRPAPNSSHSSWGLPEGPMQVQRSIHTSLLTELCAPGHLRAVGWFGSQGFSSRFLHTSPPPKQQRPLTAGRTSQQTLFSKPKQLHFSLERRQLQTHQSCSREGAAAAPRWHFLTRFQFPLSTQRLTFRLH